MSEANLVLSGKDALDLLRETIRKNQQLIDAIASIRTVLELINANPDLWANEKFRKEVNQIMESAY